MFIVTFSPIDMDVSRFPEKAPDPTVTFESILTSVKPQLKNILLGTTPELIVLVQKELAPFATVNVVKFFLPIKVPPSVKVVVEGRFTLVKRSTGTAGASKPNTLEPKKLTFSPIVKLDIFLLL